MTSGSQINYEALAQDAMRGLVRTVLQNIERDGGLPGEHHFYIAFDTEADGVDLSIAEGDERVNYEEALRAYINEYLSQLE
jgi:hypothetical protein